MTDLIKSKKMLADGGYSCVFCKGTKIYTSMQRGIKPLVDWYLQGINFQDFCASDKVVGKGAGFLYVLLNVKTVYADIISKSALEVLKENNIHVEYHTIVESIINRTGDGICPFEYAVLNINDKYSALDAILKKMDEMNIPYDKKQH